jgi:class 3 adenylate cyclase
MREWLVIATEKTVVRRALLYSLVIGPVLIAINHGQNIWLGELELGSLLQILMTVMVPYIVTTMSSVSALKKIKSSLNQNQLVDESVISTLKNQIEEARRFPEQNPNPVLKVSDRGELLYANQSGEQILGVWNIQKGGQIPASLNDWNQKAIRGEGIQEVEYQVGLKSYSFRIVSVPQTDYANIYGTDITAEKLIAKFPEQNPNPILKVTREGQLIFANQACKLITATWSIAQGDLLPEEMMYYLKKSSGSHGTSPVEVSVANRHYRFSIVPVDEFDFINIYGTDITDTRELEKAHKENERLLLNILPANIATRLRSGEKIIADKCDHVSILFADIVGFTEISSRMTPTDLLKLLNTVFCIFDELTEKYALEKIKTIGDAYMVVGGISDYPRNHQKDIGDMAIEMMKEISRINDDAGNALELRIGIHVGPVVAGVIGLKKFIFDVWGDTVNTASRMESYSSSGQIQVTSEFKTETDNHYTFVDRGEIDIKGKGPLSTFFLTGMK